MRRIGVVAVAGVILLVLVVGQLVLPGIAEQRLRDRLSRSGDVLSVDVHAFPAIELLWHHADRVVVRMGRYRSSTGALGRLVSDAGGVGSLDVSAAQVDVGLLTARDATLRKRGDRLTGTARVTEADLRTAVPILQSLVPVASSDGRLMLRGMAAVLGVSVTVDATVRPQNGALVVVPDVPFGALATITVFSDRQIEVDGASARAAPDGFTVTATARLK
jgi:hypothetical protein